MNKVDKDLPKLVFDLSLDNLSLSDLQKITLGFFKSQICTKSTTTPFQMAGYRRWVRRNSNDRFPNSAKGYIDFIRFNFPDFEGRLSVSLLDRYSEGLPSLAEEKIATIQLYLASDRLLERLISEAHRKARRSISGTPLQSRDWLKEKFDAPRHWLQKPRKSGALFEIVSRVLECKSLNNLHFYVPTVEVKK
ncbi:hypothetical protein [Roseofilum sp. Guam]|uniref:hypothetical protein n=1 Tax=Roseofilum sp. Guam TaxID=2821502 RepID=UPI001B0CABA5|nr:hypothetical protein [Roseofilum sp. Guam]MBP0031194.1 hypothetical protein [Roseofilum sp. Guam]